jgi:hypothetical protein
MARIYRHGESRPESVYTTYSESGDTEVWHFELTEAEMHDLRYFFRHGVGGRPSMLLEQYLLKRDSSK